MSESATLRDRVKLIVDHFHGGNVSAAARAVGIPNRTLANLLNGHTTSPRIGVLTAIAQKYVTSVGWLLDGQGQEPPWSAEAAGLELGDMLAWAGFVDRMALSDRAHQALFYLPWTSDHAVQAWLSAPGFVKPSIERTLRFAALNAATSLWLFTMEELEKWMGEQRLREALEDHFEEMALGFGVASPAVLKVQGAKEAICSAMREMPQRDVLRARVTEIAKLMEARIPQATTGRTRRKSTR